MAGAAESSHQNSDLPHQRVRTGSTFAPHQGRLDPLREHRNDRRRLNNEPLASPMPALLANTCPRSISLPQALHSTHIGAPRPKVLRSRPFSHESRKSTHSIAPTTPEPGNRSAAHGSLSSNLPNDELLRQMSDPAASSRHVAGSTRSSSTLRPLGRSETSPQLHATLSHKFDDLGHAPPFTEHSANWWQELAPSPVLGPQTLPDPQGPGLQLLRSRRVASLARSRPREHASAAERALSNPDILYCIIDALDAMSVIPREITHQRCKPLSLRHAQLMFGNDQAAFDAWESRKGSTTTAAAGAGLYNCLLVNSVWHDVTVRILESRIYFSSVERFTQFVRRRAPRLSRRPRMLVLHKLVEATQVELDMLEPCQLGEQLEWLEFYTCAGLAPNRSLLGSNLRNIILPGCFRANDRTLASIGERCPQLEYLDVRACEQISDRGIKIIAKRCPQLQLLNVGRNYNGELITYKAIKHLARQTKISSLGLAGCFVDDRAIWELALNRGPHVQRLSLNNCHLLTDASIPRVLGYMPNLNVLEIRGCTSITHMRPLALYRAYREKRGQAPLIDGCEIVERRLQAAILRLQRETSNRVLSDLTTFINNDSD